MIGSRGGLILLIMLTLRTVMGHPYWFPGGLLVTMMQDPAQIGRILRRFVTLLEKTLAPSLALHHRLRLRRGLRMFWGPSL